MKEGKMRWKGFIAGIKVGHYAGNVLILVWLEGIVV